MRDLNGAALRAYARATCGACWAIQDGIDVSRLRKALILVGAVAVAAAYAWLRPSAPTPYPPFVGTEASTREVKVRVVPIAPVPNQPIWHQEAETIQIGKMVEACKAEWERDAAARRGHTEP